ncbi:RNA-binding protein [Pedobacter sp. HMF7647]|uniref:RNA-binding protein n=1 Tax=Hufsiella arboris TaxID=2695275 RepID=A0A7K1YB89_9SPHI|nr:VCBS repeat-containing protein [Hufsiella arboris]MXV51843.1 RNA-binding protein [Hufsiella arboris]
MRFKLFLVASLFVVIYSSCNRPTLFEQIPSSHSNIHFNNIITENDSINPIDNAYTYNGGGVGVGDFNNDGLLDIYFTGNMVANKLYLNRGDFTFEDVTDVAGVEGKGRWARGISVIDINNDGMLDLYISNSFVNDSLRRTNLLYINMGVDKKGIPHFVDKAGEYGLDLHAHSTMAAFFDYDNDGDLDMYQAVNWPNSNSYANNFRPIITNGSYPSTGKLYRNDWNEHLKHAVFTNVSAEAGITIEGYSHGVSIADINRDGWKDIYVTNDFLSNNLLYINNHDGTFTDKAKEYFKHTSFNAMGQDIIDINNDGLADIFELDMNPEDNYRKKMMSMAGSYQTFQNFDHYGYQYQYVRNTLQLNQGTRLGENDSIGDPIFSETAFMSGVAQTDWSWAPLITDFDNDGLRDIIVTNGYPKDVTDHDFIVFRNNPYLSASKMEILKQIPEVKIHNYAFKNSGGAQFTDVSNDWGLSTPTFSNGAVYADLNNDGAMDLIINNINDEALIYKNNARNEDKNANHFLQIKFGGGKENVNGIGAWADIYYANGRHQVYENNPYRGYLSTIENAAHFGLNTTKMIDSVIICWPGNKKQILRNIPADQVLHVNEKEAHDSFNWQIAQTSAKAIFREATKQTGINYKDTEEDFIDFNIQKLLPHKLSEYSPALATADLNADGRDDIIIGGNSQSPAKIFLQTTDGKFKQRNLFLENSQSAEPGKDGGVLIFDANGDNKPDVYIAGSGYQNPHNSPSYQDRLYLNDGQANFRLAEDALPKNHTSKLCVRATDFNKDGKPDLFVSGRVDPWNYPKPVSSFLFRNDSHDGVVKFTDVTKQFAPVLQKIGMVCDALFSDFDNDGWPDLILAGEWMPIKFLRNDHGSFKDVSTGTGLQNKTGWWTSIVAGDFRHTGQMDYIIGNTGLNTLYQVSDQYPAYITANDFDNRGYFDAFPSLYLPDQNGTKKEFPANVRDDAVKQMISLRKKFTNYKSYALTTMPEMFTPAQMKGSIRLHANELRSCYLRNEGNGKFSMIPLNPEAQVSVINGMVVDDFDGDSNLDVVINGNDFGTDVSIGRYDALNGLFLKGDGHGHFKALSIAQSGIYIPGDGKALVKLRKSDGSLLLAASQRNDKLKIFESTMNTKCLPLTTKDQSAIVKYKNGTSNKQEFYYGSSFLSQSGRFISAGPNTADITIFNTNGQSRKIKLN